jgi:hypothetical protein
LGNRQKAGRATSGVFWIAATIIDGMKPETVGRVLGIGVRVAGRVAGQRMAHAAATPAGSQVKANTQVEGAVRASAASAAQARRAVSGVGQRASKGLGGLVRPFTRVGGILWLEITGAFFLLPVVVFAPTVWRTRGSWAGGPDHRTFIAATIVVAMFLYLGVSSFWRARRKARS